MPRWRSSLLVDDASLSQGDDSSIILRTTPAEPVVGLRVWRVREDGRNPQLIGLHRETAWPPRRVEVAYCHARHGVPFPRYCHCGLWAYLSSRDVRDFLRRAQDSRSRQSRVTESNAANAGVASLVRSMQGPHVVGRVALWGTVRLTDGGLDQMVRAQFARVTGIARLQESDDRLVTALLGTYRVPEISGDSLDRGAFSASRRAS